MGALRAHEVHDWREARRLRAWELFQAGWKHREIAEALGVTKGAVSQWLSRARAEGPEALRHRKPPGLRPRLAPEQQAQVPALLAQRPEAFGFRGDVWTLGRIAEVIRREFGVAYHKSQVSRMLQALGWSRQKPVRRGRQRDEEAIRHWREERWPALKKTPKPKAAP